MKKKLLNFYLAFVLLIPAMFLLSACGGKKDPATLTQITATFQDGSTTYRMNYQDPFGYEDLESLVTVTAYYSDQTTQILSPDFGKDVYTVEAPDAIKNAGITDFLQAGEYTITFHCQDKSASVTIVVEPIDYELRLRLDKENIVYGQKPLPLAGWNIATDISDMIVYYIRKQDTEDWVVYDDTQYLEVGTYEIQAVVPAFGNYKRQESSILSFTVEKADLVVNKGLVLHLQSVPYNDDATTLEYILSRQSDRLLSWEDPNYGGTIKYVIKDDPNTVLDCSDSGREFEGYYYLEGNNNYNIYPINYIVTITPKSIFTPFAMTGYSYTGRPIMPTIKHEYDDQLVEKYYTVTLSSEPAITVGQHVIATASLKDKVNYEWNIYGVDDKTADVDLTFTIRTTSVSKLTINNEQAVDGATYLMSNISDGLTLNIELFSHDKLPVDLSCSDWENASITIDPSSTANGSVNGKTINVTSQGTLVINIEMQATESCAKYEKTITLEIIDDIPTV